ncbi:MAG: 50S ribosomal protein L6, partial [Anaerolineae bacterium]
MSRIGRMPVPIPEGVQVDIKDSHVTVKGPKGELSRSFHPDMTISLQDGQIVVTRPTDNRQHRALHGLTRALLANMVTGVTEGYRRDL